MSKSNFQFNKPELEKILFNINDNFSEEKFDGIDLNATTSVTRFNENNKAKIEFFLELGKDNEASPFHISVLMSSIFYWEENIDEKMLDEFLKYNAPALLLSYIRPLVSNITSSSKYPQFDIPFLDLTNITVNITN